MTLAAFDGRILWAMVTMVQEAAKAQMAPRGICIPRGMCRARMRRIPGPISR